MTPDPKQIIAAHHELSDDERFAKIDAESREIVKSFCETCDRLAETIRESGEREIKFYEDFGKELDKINAANKLAADALEEAAGTVRA